MTHQRTPLYEDHVALGAKICPFAGHDMPIQYTDGVLQEHAWVRSRAGLFDVSHMGQAIATGEHAADFFSALTPTSFAATAVGAAKYTVLTTPQGGILDDLIITRLAQDRFFVVFNAARKAVDIAWMKDHLKPGVQFDFLADQALLAVQGPQAEEVLAQVFPSAPLATLPYMHLLESAFGGAPAFISRLGYTGEDGFEISVPAAQARALWKVLLASPHLRPIGLAARDSLRLEMGYPLYGHDLDEATSPVEASLSWIISKNHTDFIGAPHVLQQRAQGEGKRRVGITLTGPGIAREGAPVWVGQTRVGTLTSGGFSPSLKASIGQAYITEPFAQEGQEIEVEVRGKRIPARVHGLSFVKANTKRTPKKG